MLLYGAPQDHGQPGTVRPTLERVGKGRTVETGLTA